MRRTVQISVRMFLLYVHVVSVSTRNPDSDSRRVNSETYSEKRVFRSFSVYCIFCLILQSVRQTLTMSRYYPAITSQYTGRTPWQGQPEHIPYTNNDPNMYVHLQRQDTVETQQDDFYDGYHGYVTPSGQEDGYYHYGQESQDDGYIQIQDTPPEDYQGIDNHGYYQGQGIPVDRYGYQGIQGGIKPGHPIPIWRSNLSMTNVDAYAYPNTVTPALSPPKSGARHILPIRSQSSRPWSPPIQGAQLTRQRSDPNHIFHVSNGFSKLESNDPEQPKLTAEEEGFYTYKNPRTPRGAKVKDYTSFSIVLFILLGWVGCWICALAGLIYTSNAKAEAKKGNDKLARSHNNKAKTFLLLGAVSGCFVILGGVIAVVLVETTR